MRTVSGLLRGGAPRLYAVRASAAAHHAVHLARGGSRRTVCGRWIPNGASRHRVTLEGWRSGASVCFACADALRREEGL